MRTPHGGAVTLDALAARMRRGDPSAYLEWNPAPLDEPAHDALVLDAFTRGPSLPSTFYVHVPHCVSSCNFCQYFHRVTQSEATHRATLEHLQGRLARFTARVGRLHTAAGYLGGGTPTAMPESMLLALLGALTEALDPQGPLTVEAHPGTTDPATIAKLARARVTRVSMGVQTFDPALLVQITRRNPDRSHIAALVQACREARVASNVDLVVGLPGQTREAFARDLEALLALRPDTVTVYRYNPTRRLERGTLALTEALDRRAFIAWMRAGYLGLWARSDRADSVVLYRGARVLGAEAARTLRALRAPRALLARYDAFGDAPSHMLGFGPGAIGHLWGRAWVREVTALAALPRPALYTAGVLGPVDEARRAMRRALSRRGGFDAARLARLAGLDRDALERDLRVGIVRAGPLSFARPGLDARTRDALLDALTPARPPDATRAWTPPRLDEAERELVSLRVERTSRSLVEELRARVGIPGKGMRFEGALVVDRDDTGVTLAIGAKSGPRLRLLLNEPDATRPAYVQTRRYALRYSYEAGALDDEAKRIVDHVAARIRALDDDATP